MSQLEAEEKMAIKPEPKIDVEQHHRFPDGKYVVTERIPFTPQGFPLQLFRAFYRQHMESATVSSDDFRAQGLDKYCKHRNAIGFYFACWKRWGYISNVGRTRSTYPSTHGRRIDQYSFTDKAKKELGK